MGGEEELWKCPKHPSRRRRTGVCHVCLRERLSSLCPECANPRPCHRCSSAEPPLRRSRSVAVSSFRSKTIWSMFSERKGLNDDVSDINRITDNKNSNNSKGKGGGWHFPSPIKKVLNLKRSVSRGSLVHESSTYGLRC